MMNEEMKREFIEDIVISVVFMSIAQICASLIFERVDLPTDWLIFLCVLCGLSLIHI